MAAGAGKKRHRFAKSNPEFLAAWRICGSLVLFLAAFVVVLRLMGVLAAYSDMLWWELFIIVFGLTWLSIWILPRRLGSGLHICPDYLLIQKWPSTNRVFLPWQHIDSIRLETWRDRNWLDRFYGTVAFGKHSAMPYVVIRTKKMVTMPFISGRTTTRPVGFALGKVFRCYVENPEEFVEDAREFLQS
jgi:hypothetical protein